MLSSLNKIRSHYRAHPHFREKLAMLYQVMDSAYRAASDFYGFNCSGCEDNCCQTRFYHHTYLEYFYILDGYELIERRKRIGIKERAQAVCKESAEADEKEIPVKLMCPLNRDSVCRLYPYRPMICRLHGVPHELNIGGQGIRRHPGCDYFMRRFKDKSYFKFDRTGYYMEMANLEKAFRHSAGVTDKIKMTIAQMIDKHQY